MQLCVENGVIDLATGKLLDPEPSMHHSKMAGVAYDAMPLFASCSSSRTSFLMTQNCWNMASAKGSWLCTDRKHEGAMLVHATWRWRQW